MVNKQKLKCLFEHHKLMAEGYVYIRDGFFCGFYVIVVCACCKTPIAQTQNGDFTPKKTNQIINYIEENNKIPVDVKFYGYDEAYN